MVLEFLRDTDPALLKRISRKLINHLSWSGVERQRNFSRDQRQPETRSNPTQRMRTGPCLRACSEALAT